MLAGQRNPFPPLSWQKHLVWLCCEPAEVKTSPAERGVGSASEQLPGAVGNEQQRREWAGGSALGRRGGSLAGRGKHGLWAGSLVTH